MKNKISIISGIYFPHEVLFRKFLDSCLAQNMQGLEFIFLLDHPSDIKSREILSEYKDKFDKNPNCFIIVENEKNLGIYQTQMKGLDIATGEYIVFFDNDDFFDYDYLSTIYLYAKKFDANVIKGYALTHFYGKIDINFVFLCKESSVFNNDDWLYMYKKDFFKKHFNYSNMYTSDTKKEININNKFLETEIILEVPFWEGTFYHYVRHNNNTSSVFYDDNDICDENFNNDDLMDKYRIHERFLNTIKKVFNINEGTSKKEVDKLLKEYINWDDGNIEYNYEQLKDL